MCSVLVYVMPLSYSKCCSQKFTNRKLLIMSKKVNIGKWSKVGFEIGRLAVQRSSLIISATFIFSESALKFRIIRWRNTGSATFLISSRSGENLPSRIQRVFAAMIKFCAARGPAPQLT